MLIVSLQLAKRLPSAKDCCDFVKRPLTIRGTDWPTQLVENASNGLITLTRLGETICKTEATPVDFHSVPEKNKHLFMNIGILK